MKVKDTEARYILSETAQLIGCIVGSNTLGDRIVKSLIEPNERPSERNIQRRLREAIADGSLYVHGLGPKRLERLQSALSLGKALHIELPETGTIVDSPFVAAQAFREIAWAPVEQFSVLILDVKYRILSTKVISIGTATETIAHPREIFSAIIKSGGTRCMVAHNHPSGSVNPSKADLQLTQQLLEASKLLDIPLLDHLVVSGERWESIRHSTALWAEFEA